MSKTPTENLFEFLSNDTASDGLLNGYLNNPFPEKQKPPSARDIDVVKKQIIKISNFNDLSSNEQNRYLDRLLAIERKISFYTQSGATLKPVKRLFVSFRIAHSTLNHDLSLLQNLKSVVAYGGSIKVRKDANEAGLLTVEEPMVLIRYLIVFEKILSASLKLMKKEMGVRLTWALSSDELRKLRNQVCQVIEQAKIENELSQKNIFALCEAFHLAFGRIEKASNEEMPLQQEIGLGLGILSKFIQRFAESLEDRNLKIIPFASTSLHFSWASFLLDIASGADVIIHEMAHYLHSQLDVVHYLTQGLADEVREQHSPLAENLDALYLRQQKGEFSFLGDYARTNRAEFFAVASEHYLVNSVQLKSRDQDLYKMLNQVYGGRSLQFSKPSKFWFFKNMFGPLSMISHD